MRKYKLVVSGVVTWEVEVEAETVFDAINATNAKARENSLAMGDVELHDGETYVIGAEGKRIDHGRLVDWDAPPTPPRAFDPDDAFHRAKKEDNT